MNGFPAARVPAHPVLSWGSLGFPGGAREPSVTDLPHALPVMSARMALAQALRHMGARPGDRVLLPAYHCTALVEPVVHLGLEPVFFRVGADLQADPDDVEAKAAGARALVAVHYFGFPQNLEPLRRICDRHGLVLVEDCAHAPIGAWDGGAPGTGGDYALASLWKFFPVREGGLLAAAGRDVESLPMRGAGVAFEARSAVNALEESRRFRRLRPLSWLLALPLALKDLLMGWRRARRDREATAAPTLVPTGSADFDAHWIDRRPSRFTRLVVAATRRGRLAFRRRRHYASLADSLDGARGCTIPFRTLPPGVVPYVFPLLVDEPGPVFRRLKERGVPVIRFGEFLWKGVGADTCPVAADWSRRCFQFPCHQELADREVAWIAAEVKAALAAAPLRTTTGANQA